MGKKIEVKVLENLYNTLEVLEIVDGKNYRYVLTPDSEKELEPEVAAVAKEVWTKEIKEAYKEYEEVQLQKFLTKEETNE
mgnify:CR=1 FL=1|tara:strand:+ start:5611 stop:5850 length:240 start_codon:yes stop_codon:yes gene_type:complete